MKKRIFFAVFSIIFIIAYYIAIQFPKFIEYVYSQKIYRIIIGTLSFVFGYIPFSVAECIVLLVPLTFLFFLVSSVVKFIKSKSRRKTVLLKFLAHTLTVILIVFMSFQLLWGANYHRLKFSEIAKYKTSKVSKSDLKELCLHLADKTNHLKTSVNQDNNQVMKIKSTKSDLFSKASEGYKKVYDKYPQLSHPYGKPKNVMLSKWMSYTCIAGFYSFFTGEANINTSIPDVSLPHTTCHEMAHQSGFAREDEANFISYLACKYNPDPDFQYSGYFTALINSLSALNQYDHESYYEARYTLSTTVVKDLDDLNKHWEKFEGPIEQFSSKMNDVSLKANFQNDGIESYGRMVDLLIFEFNENR